MKVGKKRIWAFKKIAAQARAADVETSREFGEPVEDRSVSEILAYRIAWIAGDLRDNNMPKANKEDHIKTLHLVYNYLKAHDGLLEE